MKNKGWRAFQIIQLIFFLFFIHPLSFTVFTPTKVIIENNNILIPPITAVGILCKNPPNFPIQDKHIANTAVRLSNDGS